MTDYALVGKVVSIWGIKGELKVLPLVDSPDFFLGRRHLIFRSPDGAVLEHEISGVRLINKMVRMGLNDVRDRSMAESFRGYEVLVPVSELPALEEDRFYYYQLEGLRVLTESGSLLGILEQVIETGSNDVYVVRSESGVELLVPAIHDVIKRIDLESGEMIISPLEGMLDQ